MQARGIQYGLSVLLLLMPAIPALGQRQVTLEELAQRRARNAVRAKYTVVLTASADENRSLVAAALATRFGATLSTDLKGFIVLELPRGEAVRIAHDPRVLFVEEVKSTPQPPVIPTSVPDRPGKSEESRIESQSTLTAPEWTSGAYSYDGAGNIVSIGPDSDQKTDRYAYDALSRLTSGSVHADGIEKTQSYQYDAFGNLTQKTTTGGAVFSTPADPNTNRLTAATTAQYDAAGNLVAYGANTYFYDALGMVRKIEWSSGEQYAIYTPDEERIGYRPGGSWRFTLRDPAGKVLRQYFVISPELSDWIWEEDYVHRGGALLSSVDLVPGGAGPETFHHHLDHLGTPRLSTRQNREQYAAMTYYGFGEELAPGERSDDERLKFTGHERDFVRSDLHLDHMHARNYNPAQGRFLSPDPVLGNLLVPGSWNRYAYVLNNPINFVDPSGLMTCSPNGICTHDDSIIVSAIAPRPLDESILTDRSIWENSVSFGSMRDFFQWYNEETRKGDRLPGYATATRMLGDETQAFTNILDRFSDYLTPQSPLEAAVMFLPGGKIVNGPLKVIFKHGGRHLAGRLSQKAVEAAVRKQVQGQVGRATVAGGSFWGRVTVSGEVIQYRAYALPNGTVSVGTYWPIK